MTEEMAVVDDLEMELNPEDYPEQKPATPPAAGTYRMLLRKASWRLDRTTGQRKLVSGNYPILVIECVEIIDPVEDARKFYPYCDIYTKPFPRDGKTASNLADLLRSFEKSAVAAWGRRDGRDYETYFDDAMEILQGYIQTEQPFTGSIDWKAFSKSTADAMIQQLGTMKELLTKEQKKVVYGRASIEPKPLAVGSGMRQFPKLDDGSYSPYWKSPSGEVVEAQVKLTRYWPEGMALKLGKAA